MSKITDKGMQATPTKTPQWLNEGLGRGNGSLVGRISPNGERLLYYRYLGSARSQVRQLIGPFDPRGDGSTGFTVGQARQVALRWAALRREQGITDLREHLQQVAEDLRVAEELERQRLAEEQRAREAAAAAAANRITVRQAFDRWRATDLQPVIRADGRRAGRKDGGQFVFEQFSRHVFPLIGERALADVRKADLLAVIDAQKAKGQLRTAAMLLGDLKQLLAFALDRDLILTDPLATVKKARVVGTPTQRERALSDAELQRLPSGLENARMSPRSVAAVWLILATGLRIGELLGAVWAEDLPTDDSARKSWLAAQGAIADKVGVKLGIVDTDSRIWHLPDTKNQRPHTIHLSDFALAHIECLRQYREVLPGSIETQLSPWLFPATDSRRPVCPKSLSKQLADRQRDGDTRMSRRSMATQALLLPGGPWRAHDLRRTMATLLARLGISSDVINAATNHVDPNRMTQTYIVDRREAEQRAAFETLGLRLAELSGAVMTSANVVPLRAA